MPGDHSFLNTSREPTHLVFLDRDGTVIEEVGYLSDPARVRLLPGVAEAIARLNRAGVAVALVTNQSGIGRGLFTEDQYLRVHAEMVRQLQALGAHLDAHVYCPDAPGQTPSCRKPAPAIFERAAQQLGLTPRRAAFIGDQPRDVLPAEHFEGTGWLVGSGHPVSPEEIPVWVRRVPGLADAVRLLLEPLGP